MNNQSHLAEAKDKLELIFNGGVNNLKVGIAFSGGKDSMVLLDLCKPYIQNNRAQYQQVNNGVQTGTDTPPARVRKSKVNKQTIGRLYP